METCRALSSIYRKLIDIIVKEMQEIYMKYYVW